MWTAKVQASQKPARQACFVVGVLPQYAPWLAVQSGGPLHSCCAGQQIWMEEGIEPNFRSSGSTPDS